MEKNGQPVLEILNGWDAGKQVALINRVGGRRAADAIAAGQMRVTVSPVVSPEQLFSSPEEQVERVLEVNETIWRDCMVDAAEIRALGPAPECPPSDAQRLYGVMLLAEAGDALATLQRNWLGCQFVLGLERTEKWDGVVFTPQGVRPRPGAKKRPVGLRWSVVEFGRAYQKQPIKLVCSDLDRKGLMGMGQELPAIGMLHPRLALAMDGGKKIPFVGAPDLQIAPGAEGVFLCAPYLRYDADSDCVGLGADLADLPLTNYGVGSLW